MKKTIITIAAALLAFSASALNTTLTAAGAGGTNTVGIFDLSESTRALIQVDFTGAPERSNQGVLVITNPPAAGATLDVVYGATTNTYTWAATVATTTNQLLASAPKALVGVEAVPSVGDTFTIIRSNLNSGIKVTNILVWTNAAPVNQNLVLAGASAAASATNLYTALKNFGWTAPYVAVGYFKSTGVLLQGQPNESWWVTNSATWATNLNTTYYSVTNAIAANTRQIATNATAAGSATNLYTKLATEYAGQLNVSVAAATVSLSTVSNGILGFTASAGWATNNVVTNAIAGNITLVASNSIDGATWYPVTTNSITIAFSGTSAVSFATNYNGLAYPYFKYTLQNPLTNCATASGFKMTVDSKKGL